MIVVEQGELVEYQSEWFSVVGDLDDFIFYENEQNFTSER